MKFGVLIFCLVWPLCMQAMNSERKKLMEILEQKKAEHSDVVGSIQEALTGEASNKQKELLEGLVKTLQITIPNVFYRLIQNPQSPDNDRENICRALLLIAASVEKISETSQAALQDQREQGEIEEEERRFNRCCIFYQEFKTAIAFIGGVLGSGTVTALITYFSTNCDQ